MGIAERIGLDVRSLEVLCSLAGISHLKITTISGEGAQQSIIMGQNRKGSAYGGFINAEDMTHASLMPLPSGEDNLLFRLALWDSAEIVLDLDIIKAEVEQSKKGLRDAKKWVEVLNRKLKVNFGKLVLRRLVKEKKIQYLY